MVSLSTLSDTELIRSAQRGDMDAFEELVYRHDKEVFSIAARYVNRAEDAKDIYQEVFLRVYRGLQKFRFQSEFSTWLYRITTNVCLTHRNHRKKMNSATGWYCRYDRTPSCTSQLDLHRAQGSPTT